MIRKLITLAVLVALSFGVTACKDESPADRLGDAAEEAQEAAGDAAEDAQEAADDLVE